ncbi:hypothetical protein APHAL10511_003822 [Amanita phalloides]|nr:hypothetical protein APHAL10511_003822 [Amanita phalloides]
MVDLDNNYEVQYQNRRLEDLKEGLEANREVTCDGIEGALLENFHGATQELCSVLKPTRAGPEAHHDWMASEPNPRVMRYQVKGSEEVMEERKFVAHLVHCWPQQAQPEKFTDEEKWHGPWTGQGILQRHPDGGADISTHVQSIYYKEYKAAFDAGQWVEQDPGPWLGRAIVYKLQSSLHLDGKDFGPTACIPFGFFTGGEMAVPQFEAKLSYVSLSNSSPFV